LCNGWMTRLRELSLEAEIAEAINDVSMGLTSESGGISAMGYSDRSVIKILRLEIKNKKTPPEKRAAFKPLKPQFRSRRSNHPEW
jgi:hypothetical protein